MVCIEHLILQAQSSSCTAGEQVVCCNSAKALYSALICTRGLLSYCKCHFTFWLKTQKNYSGHLWLGNYHQYHLSPSCFQRSLDIYLQSLTSKRNWQMFFLWSPCSWITSPYSGCSITVPLQANF